MTLKCSKTEIQVGESIIVENSITPHNTTDKSIKWTSSNEEIASVDENGKVMGKSIGIVTITAITTNQKSSEIKITVKEAEKQQVNEITTVANVVKDDMTEEESNPLVGIVSVGLLAGGGYWGYKKFKK